MYNKYFINQIIKMLENEAKNVKKELTEKPLKSDDRLRDVVALDKLDQAMVLLESIEL